MQQMLLFLKIACNINQLLQRRLVELKGSNYKHASLSISSARKFNFI